MVQHMNDFIAVTSVFYNHNFHVRHISQTRMLGATRKNSDVIDGLCGQGEACIILGTAKWGDVAPEVGERRAEQLSRCTGRT